MVLSGACWNWLIWLARRAKKVFLVDHNEPGQAVDGLQEAQVMGIIDHHRLGAFTTDEPVKIIIEPVGSTSTLVAREYVRQDTHMTRQVATLLLGGLVSDTLNLQSVTTTPLDVDIAQFLKKEVFFPVMNWLHGFFTLAFKQFCGILQL